MQQVIIHNMSNVFNQLSEDSSDRVRESGVNRGNIWTWTGRRMKIASLDCHENGLPVPLCSLSHFILFYLIIVLFLQYSLITLHCPLHCSLWWIVVWTKCASQVLIVDVTRCGGVYVALLQSVL